MSLYTLQPDVMQQFLDNNGEPLAGGKVYYYQAGSFSVLQDTYSNSTGTLNDNPVILDNAGRAYIFWQATSYNVKITDANDVTIRTIPGVPSTGLVQGTVNYTVHNFGGDPNSPVTALTYPTGALWTACHAGTDWFQVDSGNLAGTYVLTGMLRGTGSVGRIALVNLSDGTPDTPIVSISSASFTGTQQSSGVITFAAPGAVKTYAIKTKQDAETGFAWGIAIVRTA